MNAIATLASSGITAGKLVVSLKCVIFFIFHQKSWFRNLTVNTTLTCAVHRCLTRVVSEVRLIQTPLQRQAIKVCDKEIFFRTLHKSCSDSTFWFVSLASNHFDHFKCLRWLGSFDRSHARLDGCPQSQRLCVSNN